MTTILGMSALYHDSAAAIVVDGEIIAAAQEERFSRRKHDSRFPREAINYCLGEAFIDPDELDAIVFYDHPLLTLDRLLKTSLTAAPGGAEQWSQAGSSLLSNKLFIADHIRDALQTDVKVLFTEHHAAHAASAFYPSPFREAAILTMDGVGEWDTTTIGRGADEKIEILQEIKFPHSLGLLYSAFTYFTGFRVNSGEYKVMGLAPYGKPIYADLIREHLIHLLPDGSFRLDLSYFGFLDSMVMTNQRFADLFGGPPRAQESPITRREMDLAASVQQVTEEVVLATARHAREVTGLDKLVLAGGVALNCVANGLLQREGIFDQIWIQPAAGDAGGALGAALLISHQQYDIPRRYHPAGRDTQKGSYLGPAFSRSEVHAFLDRKSYPFESVEELEPRCDRIAEALEQGKVVGFLSGRMEFGPRALGARSILCDPRSPDAQTKVNLQIKYRESFRPFAPSVLAERCSDYFEMEGESPYMLLVAPVQHSRRENPEPLETDGDDLLPIVRQVRSDIPAVTHVDYSARVQTVGPDDMPEYYQLLKSFDERTGCGLLVNTSFNVRGEPIVCTPQDAYRCFMRTEMDMLVLEDCILLKEEQPAWHEGPPTGETDELD